MSDGTNEIASSLSSHCLVQGNVLLRSAGRCSYTKTTNGHKALRWRKSNYPSAVAGERRGSLVSAAAVMHGDEFCSFYESLKNVFNDVDTFWSKHFSEL